MARRFYTTIFPPVTIGIGVAPFDIFEIIAPTGIKLFIQELVFLYDVDDPNDAATESGRYELRKGTGGYTSGNGTAIAAGDTDWQRHDPSANAGSATGFRYSQTPAVAGGGALLTRAYDIDTAINGWVYRPAANLNIFEPTESMIYTMTKALKKERTFRGQLVIAEVDV